MSSFGPVDASNVEAYCVELDSWHLELAILWRLIEHVLLEIDGPPWMGSAANIIQQRFDHLLDTCPFPERVWQRDARLIGQLLESSQ